MVIILAYEMVRREFGGDTSYNVNVFDVATTPIQILKNNPQRVMVVVQNIGAANVYINFNVNVSSSDGLLLAANGGLISLIVKEDGALVCSEMYAVGDGTSKLMVLEVYILGKGE